MQCDTLLFYLFSGLLLSFATMVITTRHPIRGILFLILSFLCAAVLWMLLEAEFLSLVLVFVYVGAVMMLFLFVVMMLNTEVIAKKRTISAYWPVGLLISSILGVMMWQVIHPLPHTPLAVHGPHESNIRALGAALYTQHLVAFELAAVILLAAIIAAVGLIFRGPRTHTKIQQAHQQMRVTKSQRLRVVSMDAES